MIALRLLAGVVAVLGVLPLWRVLPAHGTGLAGAATADAAAAYSGLMWNGVLLALIPAVLAALLFDAERLEQALRTLVAPLARVPSRLWAALMGVAATALAAVVAIGFMAGKPTLIDSFAQLTQARYLAAGRLAGPVLAGQPFWHIQQTIVTPNGWVSQYPPGYIVLLALGFLLHAVAWVGPVSFGVAAFFTALIADEIFESRALARVASLLAAVSPFMIGLAGAYMSHVPACALTTASLYFVLRARRGHWSWAVAAGVSMGALFAIRPLTAVVAAIVAGAYAAFTPMPSRGKAQRLGAAALAALPFLILVGWYNAHFFGHATTFGYTAALGPHGGLGFGLDPWGNRFGPLESLAYTSAELAALNVFLLEAPLPLVLFVGLHFALTPARQPRVREQYLLFGWVAALLVANFFYWHHGLFMGPRMLADAGTLWVLLVVLGMAGLVQRIRSDWNLGEKYSVRAFVVGGSVAALLAGVLLFGPQRLLSYRVSADMKPLLQAPVVKRPALVFVHGGWTARVAMRLAGHGMRLDSVETALRQNGTCSAHNFASAYARGQHSDAPLVFAAAPPRATRTVVLAPGDRMRVTAGERIDAGCVREMDADRAGGAVDVSPYMWQADLPGLPPRGALFVRDMGPADNAQLMAQQPGRAVFMLRETAGGMQLAPYESAMAARWGAQP